MKITIGKLKQFIREAIKEGKYDSLNNTWDSDPEWMQRGKLAKMGYGDSSEAFGKLSDPWAPKPRSDYEQIHDDDQDELTDDYLQTTGQGEHEMDPYLYGVQDDFEDPLYSRDFLMRK